jgi:putative ABC transport system permease protein
MMPADSAALLAQALAQPQAGRWRAAGTAAGECLRSAIGSIRAHGLRSFLTMLGIIIGVASVIAVIALVQGLSNSIGSQFQGLGGNTLTLRAETPPEEELRGRKNRLRLSDLDQLKHRVAGIRHLTPSVTAGGGVAEVRNGAHAGTGLLQGTTARYQQVQQIYPRYGRFLSEADDASRRRVVVLGDRMRRDLKLPANPSGRHIQINGEWFKVIGVMEPRGEVFGLSQDNYLLMPYQTALAVNGLMEEPDLSISFAVEDIEQTRSVRERVTALLRELHGLKPGQPNDFVVESSDTLEKAFEEVSLTVTLVLAGVVSISLLVGGIGIMNIMLVSVTERTREIGIVKALGAPRRFILMQFLMEAMLLALLGGLIGVALGYGLGFGIAQLIPDFPDPSVPWWAVLGASGFSGLVGIVFGILPASNAADLTPIEALRHE